MMSTCNRCGKDVDGIHTCTPPWTYAADDLIKRLDKLERCNVITAGPAIIMVPRRRGEWVRFDQVKETIRQWVAEQEGSDE